MPIGRLIRELSYRPWHSPPPPPLDPLLLIHHFWSRNILHLPLFFSDYLEWCGLIGDNETSLFLAASMILWNWCAFQGDLWKQINFALAKDHTDGNQAKYGSTPVGHRHRGKLCFDRSHTVIRSLGGKAAVFLSLSVHWRHIDVSTCPNSTIYLICLTRAFVSMHDEI